MESFNSEAEVERAFEKILCLLNFSDRSEVALRARLGKAGFEAQIIDKAIERAKTSAIIDDERFGRCLIRSRLNQGKGLDGIERELRRHGIEAIEIEGWPEEFGAQPDGEVARAVALLSRKPPRSKNPRQSAFRKALTSGYGPSVAAKASQIWFESLKHCEN